MPRTLFAAILISCLPQLAATYLAGTRTVDSAVPHRNYAEVEPGIRLANGSLAYYQTDLETKGRVLGLTMRRVWRSDMTYDGPFGQGWTCEYTQAAWKDATTDDIHWHDADGFLHTFYKGGGSSWITPPGVYVAAGYDSGVRLRKKDGTRLEFNAGGQITAIIDRYGNDVTLSYDQYDRLETIADDRGFEWELVYDGNDRVIELIDHVWETATRDPRSVEYEYDGSGNLIAVYMPETARYNESSANRVTWEYAYDGNDRLTDVYAPNESYANGASVKSFVWEASSGRIVGLRDGDASAEHQLRYTQTAGGTPLVRHITPSGTRTDYELDSYGRVTKIRRYTGFWEVSDTDPLDHSEVELVASKLRASDPDHYDTAFTYNDGHERTEVVHPDGSSEQFTFPDPTTLAFGKLATVSGSTVTVSGANWTPGAFTGGYLRLGSLVVGFSYFEIASNTYTSITVVAIDLEALGWGMNDRYVAYTENSDSLAAGNLLEQRRVSADSQQADIVRSWTYEPYFQQVRSATSERGHTTTWEFGFDTSGDPESAGASCVTKMFPPSVTVIQPDGATSSVTYETEYTYNSFGQLTGVVDPDDGVEVRNYYTTGFQAGFLEEVIRGYGEQDLTEVLEYDKTGLLTGQYPPGAFAQGVNAEDYKTTWRVNELSQTWYEEGPEHEGERAETYRYFDPSGNEVCVWCEYVTADGDAPDAPSDEDNPATFSRSSTPMDATWVLTARTYDIAGRVLTETTDIEAGTPVVTATWENEYDALGNLTARISPLGKTTEFEYDERFLLWKRTEGAGSAVEATYETDYDLNGRVEVQRTPLGNETENVYDGHGRLTRVTDPEGHYREFGLDVADNVVTERVCDSADNTLAEMNWTFDQIERVYIETILALNAAGQNIGGGEKVTRFTLDGRGLVAKRNEGSGRTWLFEYDDARRLIQEQDPFGNLVEYTLDLDGNVTRIDYDDYNEVQDDTESASWEANYNTLGHATKVRDRRHQGAGFDTEVEYFWDAWGRLAETLDAADAHVQQDYDLRSLPTERREGTSAGFFQVNGAKWNEDGGQFSVDIWESESGTSVQSTTYDYDERRRLTCVTHPDESTREFEWDDDSNLAGWTDETGSEVLQTHDDNGRVVERDMTHAGATAGVDREMFEYDGAGRMIECESFLNEVLQCRVAWTWNTLGRPESSTLTLGGSIGAWISKCEYDVHGDVVTYVFSDDDELDVSRDVLGRIASVVNTSTVLAEFGWAGADRPALIELGNGIDVSLSYETGFSNLVEDLHHKRGSETLWRFERRYDERGLPIRERRAHQGAAGRASEFDAARRMVGHYLGADLAGSTIDSATAPTGFGIKQGMILDMRGNRTGADAVNLESPTSVVRSVQYNLSTDGMNRYAVINGAPRSHDEQSRLTADSDAGLDYVWDYRSRLVRMEDANATIKPVRLHTHDAAGRRVLEDDVTEGVLNRRTVLVYAPDGVLLEEIVLDDQNDEVERVQYAPGPCGVIAENHDGEWRYHYHDQDGSLIGLTNENGERIAEFDYLPFGAPVRTGVLLDVAPSEVSSVSQDTSAAGTTRVTLSTALTTSAYVGFELAVSVPGASSDRYRSGAVTGNGMYTIDVNDPDDLIYDALQNLGSGFVVLDARLSTATPSVTYDGQTDTTTMTVSGAGFSQWLTGGWLLPDVTRPGYLRIIEVDSSGDWVKVRGDATSVFQTGANYRVLPPFGSTHSAFDDDPGARLLWRGMRHDYAARFDGWPGDDLARSGLYLDGGRMFDPASGRYLTPSYPWPNPYMSGGFTPPAAVLEPSEKSLLARQRPAQVLAPPECRCDGPGWRGWSE